MIRDILLILQLCGQALRRQIILRKKKVPFFGPFEAMFSISFVYVFKKMYISILAANFFTCRKEDLFK